MKRDLLKTLQAWKNDNGRKPLIIRGARQVGKSWLVEDFGRNEFEQLVVINFELQPEYVSCFRSLDPRQIVLNIELNANKKISPGKTLLFLDEIQACPQAIKSLRYFYEKMPFLHVIAAGSLIEFSLNADDFSVPVGRVSNYYLYPFSFGEFLSACGEEKLRSYLRNITLNNANTDAVDKKCRDLLRIYFYIGGMPESIKTWKNDQSFHKTDEILQNLLQNYKQDFGKYGRRVNVELLEKVYTHSTGQVGSRFKYTAIDPHIQSRDIRSALDLLTKARIIHKIPAASGSGLPLGANVNEKIYKILYLDVGLLQNSMGIGKETYMTENLLSVYKGAVAEQYAGQQLISLDESYKEPQLFFWKRDTRGSEAEVDYLWQKGGQIFPVEVKAGTTGSMKSMRMFLKEFNVPFGIRFSMHPLSFTDSVLNIPLYAVEALPGLLDNILNK